MPAADYEKLGVFYLGRPWDPAQQKALDQPLLYESQDLVTHAVCVGMTGSGKTGLCIGLLEEAAIDGIPAILIDPKGDLANLLLTFPQLRAEDFAPWINAEDARTQGVPPEEFAAQQAQLWQKGLAGWDQDAARIQRLKDAADFCVYTPGSDAGVPVSVMKSFGVPDQAILDDREMLRDRISATATSLLGLVGIDADPVQSREHVLLSTLLGRSWDEGRDLDLPALIGQIQKPPFSKVGVMDLDSFFPAADRFPLAMALNNLLASPGFEAWLEGEPLDVQRFLYTAEGKPRVAIFSIAHLSDAERMFFVSLLLNQVLSWVRTQSGTTSLRAILYMDEIFGYFPPVQNPPSKRPLLTLLKQARAYGLGVVLATQNPVDLDYKGLANAGTWFIGRLQTERDKDRVLDGLEGAAAQSGGSFDRAALDQILSGLGKRVFLLNNVHEKHPLLFQTRWTMSYLRGPLSRTQIKQLMAGRKTPAATPAAAPAKTPLPAASTAAPVLPPDVPQFYLPARTRDVVAYEPMAIGAATIKFTDAKLKIDETREIVVLATIVDDAVGVSWDTAREEDVAIADLETTPADKATFADLPSCAAKPKNYTAWSKAFSAWVYNTQKVDLLKSPSTGEISRSGESEGEFRVRLQQAAREERDTLKEKLQLKYGPKLTVLEERKRKAEQRVAVEKEQAQSQTLSTAMSVGASLLGAFLGRKTFSATNVGRVATAARSASRTMKERSDIGRASETVEAIQAQIDQLNADFEAEVAAMEAKVDPAAETFETIFVRPKKTGITVRAVALAWVP